MMTRTLGAKAMTTRRTRRTTRPTRLRAAGAQLSPPGPPGPQCYTCQSLRKGESCKQLQSCVLPRTCKAIVSSWNAESGPQTTYSGWCADMCHPISRTVEGSLTTISCCQASLCNAPPWQEPQGRGAGGPRGSPVTVAATLLLSLLASLLAMGV
ncbi:glycosylphosphatidylinositol-anchored high density lipoprotein-binding protein 1 isoform X2 [Moschus berezovskii]|uniref:glycosylphosphatidylinositol-anchored high density lipoprotein-binding protein 1 isoform X2 n=1 Tax=Moschus berezovskii TaxID=68408 RepID=UPI002443E7F8|nr:glycosylphosphatidylinositol-anchored high density lipoprotein-binding protein 1 isoform X2 [Moschus berezovskii]